MKKHKGFIDLIGIHSLSCLLQGCNMPGWGNDDRAMSAGTQTMLTSIADAMSNGTGVPPTVTASVVTETPTLTLTNTSIIVLSTTLTLTLCRQKDPIGYMG